MATSHSYLMGLLISYYPALHVVLMFHKLEAASPNHPHLFLLDLARSQWFLKVIYRLAPACTEEARDSSKGDSQRASRLT